MSFTYNITSGAVRDQMRLLIGDTAQATANFQDEELDAIISVTQLQVQGPPFQFYPGSVSQFEVLFMSCAAALDALAAKVAQSPNGQSVQLGDFKLTGKDQVEEIKGMADRFREAINNLPAWGVAEENLCGFNELVIIRNWVLRTEM